MSEWGREWVEPPREDKSDRDRDAGGGGSESGNAFEARRSGRTARSDAWLGRISLRGAGVVREVDAAIGEITVRGSGIAESGEDLVRIRGRRGPDVNSEAPDPWEPGQARSPAELEDHASASPEAREPPLPLSAIAQRTTENRIDLADNVDRIALKPTYGGYLDVVMHGDATGTQAFVDREHVDFTLAQTARLVESSPSWNERPIRLMSCSTGRDDYAQRLADRIRVPVYAPEGVLHVLPDGETRVESPDGHTPGRWRRFEPRP